jgi:hypothetical protein
MHYRGGTAETAAVLNVKFCVLVVVRGRKLPLFSPILFGIYLNLREQYQIYV